MNERYKYRLLFKFKMRALLRFPNETGTLFQVRTFLFNISFAELAVTAILYRVCVFLLRLSP